jgi:hypothetical protein
MARASLIVEFDGQGGVQGSGVFRECPLLS